MQYIVPCVFSLPISLVKIVRICVFYLIIIKSEVRTISHCLPCFMVRSWNNGTYMRCMSCYVLLGTTLKYSTFLESRGKHLSFVKSSVEYHIASGLIDDSTDVVSCAKFCSDQFITFWMRTKWNFRRNWIAMNRSLLKPFIQAQIEENIKAPRHWPLCGEFTDDRWIPRTNGQ